MQYIRFHKFIFLFFVSFLFHSGIVAQVTPQTFNCTGSPQNFVVPPCVTSVTVECWGAGGGGGGIDTYTGSPGGGGAYATKVVPVTPGQVLTVIVGCGGSQGGACAGNGPGGAGGYGYGNGGNGGNSGPNGCSGPGGGGGGGSALLNGGTPLVVAGGGGGGGGGGNYGDGGNGGGGGQAGSAQSSAGGILGASGSTNGLSGATTANDGAGGGGGGGGVNGGGGGQVPGTDYGGSGGAGGTSLGTSVINGSGQTPGNAGSPNLCAGCAIGGNGGSGAPGVPGDLVISYTTPVALTSNIASTNGCGSATATVTPTSGVGGYTYTWSPSGGNAATASGLTNGNYTVNFTDANGCTGTNTLNVAIPITVTGTVTTSPGTCGIATATVAASGGAGGYTYTWSPTGGNGITATLSNGSYTVSIKDAGGCIGSATTTIALPSALTLTAVQTNVTCNGLANGSATATASGGTGPYTYAWGPGAPQISVTGIATGLSGGITYTAGVQDAAGCQDTVSLTITQPAVLQQTLTATNPICVGASSVLNDAVSGGTSPYTVTWSSGGSFVGAAGTTTVSPVTATTYSASVLDSKNCANTTTVTVTVNPLPVVTANSITICVGSSAILAATGASTYAWSPAAGLSAATGASVTANPGATTVYTITGTDVNTCTSTATSTVIVNPLPVLTAASATICVGSSATMTVSGANSYAWSPATGLSGTTGNNVTANPGATTIYTITGTDANSCINTATTTVTVNALPAVTVTSGTICAGSSISVTANGASTYSWASATGLSSTTGNIVTAFPAATTVYTVTGTDVNNCVNTATSTITVNPLPIPSAGSNSPICVNQTLNLNSGGGITYAWTGPNSFASPSQNPSVASVTIADAGTYTVVVTDANNCQATATTSVTINTLPIVVVNSATICAGSTTTLTASGAISYTWSPGTGLSSAFTGTVAANPVTTTTYTITGDNGCLNTATATVTVNPLPNVSASSATVCPTLSGTLTANGASTYSWSTGAATQSVSIAPPSTTVYTVIGTDIKNCSSSATATITVNPALVLTIGGTTPICQGATLNLTVSPGIAWIWQGPNAYSSFSQNPSIPNAQPNMSATYSVGAQDANGCTDTAFISITVNPLPIPVASNNSAICSNQTLNFSGVGGTTYTWTGSGGFSVIGQNPIINNAPVTASGIYTLTVTDANNCVNSDTTLVIVNPTPTVTVNSPTICIGNSANLTASGGAVGGTYTWTPSTDLSSSVGSPVTATPTITSSYSVTAINITGCVGSATCAVTVNPLPTITVNSGTICVGKSISLQALNANTYSWTPSVGLSNSVGATVSASPAASTTYIVTGTDINGCSNTASAFVLVNPLPSIIASPQTTSGCEPLCVSFANTGLSNGAYSWNFGDGKTDNTSAPSHCYSQGAYSVTVQLTDSNGCIKTSSANVIAFPTPVANFYASPQPTTILDPNIDFVDGTSGGATIATWGWNFGDGHGVSLIQNPSYMYLDTGIFAVQLVVTSDLGCVDTVVINVTIDDEYLIYVPNAFSPNFDGVNDMFMPKGEGVTSYKLYVYDRWGSLAFSSHDIMLGWDGRHLGKGSQIAQEDVYIWKIEAKNKKGQPKILKGIVSLIK